MFGTPDRLMMGVLVGVLMVIVSPLTELLAATLVTVPAPVGTAHVPSPRQKVPAEALVPEFRFPTGRFPLTSLARLTDATVLITPPVAFTQQLDVNLPICFPCVLLNMAACPIVEVDVSEVTSPVPPPPPPDPSVQRHVPPSRKA
jgi:hypothetical protein